MNTVLHIAPQLPPAIDGVGDYCWNLWRHWPDRETRWHVAAIREAEATRQYWPAVTVHGFDASSGSLQSALETSKASTVVLHYVGYGYHPKGIPVWLPRALEEWRNRAASGRRLITMFHEMYAQSSPLRSPFWVKPWAIQIIRDLVQSSDAWVTNCASYRHWLITEFDADSDSGTLIPIGSNIPSATELHEDRLWPTACRRKLRFVIFGLPNTRLWALKKHARLLAGLVKQGLVESILLAGKSPGTADGRYNKAISRYIAQVGGQWQTSFDLPGNEAADALSKCDVGLIANDGGTLTKSGVFAAMAANGVVSIIASGGRAPLPPACSDCVLVNEDTDEGSWASIASELSGVNRMTARRRMTLQLAATELSWSNVAMRFHEAVANAARVTAVRHVTAPEALAERQGVSA